MQEFLSGKAFEEMAREYNAKYGMAKVLQDNQNKESLPTKDKEKIYKILERDFEYISSLFLFIKQHMNKVGRQNFGGWSNYYFLKLKELENKTKEIKDEIFGFLLED